MFNWTTFEQNIKNIAANLGTDAATFLTALAHFSAVATPVAQVVETATGNAELAPLTGVVNTTIQTANEVATAASTQKT